MTFQYQGVNVENVQYNGVDVDVLQYNGVVVWERVTNTILRVGTNVFDTIRGVGGALTGGSITEVLGAVPSVFTVSSFGEIKLEFPNSRRPFNATSISVEAVNDLLGFSTSLTWNGRWFSGRDSRAGQLFSYLQPSTTVELFFEQTG